MRQLRREFQSSVNTEAELGRKMPFMDGHWLTVDNHQYTAAIHISRDLKMQESQQNTRIMGQLMN